MKTYYKVIHIILAVGFWVILAQTPLLCQSPNGANFDINSQTLIVDGDGNYIDFKTFIGLNPGSDYSDLMPEFDDKGNLSLIKINLIKPLKIKDEKPKSVVASTTTRKVVKPVPRKNTIAAPKVEEKTTKKKFRFTTAKELEGLQAPYYNEKDINNKEQSTSSLYGKIVIIKFWFLKCAPCLEEIPELNKLVDKYKNNPDVKFIAPATDDASAIKSFISKKNFKYTILPDSYNIHGDFKVAGYPTHLVIYKNGIVGKVLTGKNSALVNVLSSAIEEGLLMDSDDKAVVEIPQPMYTSDLVIKAEEGYRLNKEEYLNKLASGQYRIYKKTKIDGREEILLKNIMK